MSENKKCKISGTPFEITDADLAYYTKMGVPSPTLCPDCRQQRRLIWANQFNLYKRKCDATGDDIISAYHSSSPLKVYRQSYWWSDKFDAMDYGQPFDFNRPFFEQWNELSLKVPRPSLHTGFQFDENCEYTNFAGNNRNCYMIFDSDFNEDCYYSQSSNKSKNCLENYRVKECELCYECVDCVKSYNLKFSQDCDNCSDSAFLKNCTDVRYSFMCSNLKNKEYYIFNQPFPREKYEKLMATLTDHSALAAYMKDWESFKLKFPQKFTHGVQNENVLGDYLVYSKNAQNCFDSMELWDCKYFFRAFGQARDCMDCDECGEKVSLLYESTNSGFNLEKMRGSMFCFHEEHDLDYCFYCNFSSDCFGCIGLRRKKYCILNKQYTKEDYETLVPKIIDHMKKTNEWGEFFPAKLSDFAYNETVAQEFFPLTQKEAVVKGFRWRSSDKKEYLPANATIPTDTKSVTESICDALLACEACGRNYKIIQQEFKFYKNQGLAFPKKCFYCRHQARFALRNKRKLYDRTCAKCGGAIKTTYSPDQPQIVYCESCYLKEVY